MFDISLLEKFRNPEFENDEKVKYAWFIYCYEIMRCVSLNWKKHISPHTLNNRGKLDLVITCSDEAFGRWLLNLKIPELLAVQESGTEHVNLKKRKGPHDSKIKMQYYSTIYVEVKKSRQDKKVMKKWNEIFWDQVDIHCKNELNKACIENNLRMVSTVTSEHIVLPSRDVIDEEDPY